jgi:hypothetical protein
MKFTALRINPTSLSHWGEFDIPTKHVLINVDDLGLIDGYYVSKFEFDELNLYAKTPTDIPGNLLDEERQKINDAALLANGIDPSTMDFISQ